MISNYNQHIFHVSTYDIYIAPTPHHLPHYILQSKWNTVIQSCPSHLYHLYLQVLNLKMHRNPVQHQVLFAYPSMHKSSVNCIGFPIVYTSNWYTVLRQKVFKIQNLKTSQILCAHKPYFLMPGHNMFCADNGR